MEILGWPKSSFGFFRKMLRNNPNELLGQPSKSALYQKPLEDQQMQLHTHIFQECTQKHFQEQTQAAATKWNCQGLFKKALEGLF